MNSAKREILPIIDGWKYTSRAFPMSARDAYQATKTGAALGPASMSFPDGDWETVRVPHDAALRADLNPLADCYHGYMERPDTWYRRLFTLDAQDRGRRLLLRFAGVTGKTDLYVNGAFALRSESSFVGFEADITDIARFDGEPNLIALHSDNQAVEGWWYEGAGIYRDAYLIKSGPVSFLDEETFIKSEEKDADAFDLRVKAGVYNALGAAGDYRVRAELLDDENKLLVLEEKNVSLGERGCETIELSMQARGVKRWDVYAGKLYTLRLSVFSGDTALDEEDTKIGFRSIDFDANKGFLINGRPLKLKGLCYHEDEGNLGVALEDKSFEERVRHLIGMGGNAYRCAHNAPNPRLLDICDRMGILVLDETRAFASTPAALDQLEKTVRRDRNHPCVALWSLGNEEPWQADERGERMVKTMRARVRELDPTRKVTMAMNGGHLSAHSAAAACDVIGLNYNIEDYDKLRALYPDKPIVATEVFSLADENEENGLYCAEEAVKTQRLIASRDYLCGSFGWAGQDYRGEHRYLSFFTDACPVSHNGIVRDGFYRYQAAWTDVPVLHICGHWNYAAGETAEVRVFSNAHSVELLRNGAPVGSAEPGDAYKATFRVPFEAGEITAIGRDASGAEIARERMETAGDAVAIRLRPDSAKARANGCDLIFLSAEAVDAQGRLSPLSSHLLSFSVSAGEVLAADNADFYFLRGETRADAMFYHGRARAVLRMPADGGELICEATSPDLASGGARIALSPAKSPSLPRMESPYIDGFFISHVFAEKPDISSYTEDRHYIRLSPSEESTQSSAPDNPFYFRKGWVIYCAEPNLPRFDPEKRAFLVFEDIAAGAELLITLRDYQNRTLRQYRAESKADGTLRVALDGAKSGDRLIIKIVFDSGAQPYKTLGAPVRFQFL